MFKCTKTRPNGDQLIAEMYREFDMGFGIGDYTAEQLRIFVMEVLHSKLELRLKHLRALHEEVEVELATKLMKSTDCVDKRFNDKPSSDWRSTDPELQGFDLVNHVAARFGRSSGDGIMVKAGRQRLLGPLKLFVFRNLMKRSGHEGDEEADRFANYALCDCMSQPPLSADFPWSSGSELTADEIDDIQGMLPEDVKVKHAYWLLAKLEGDEQDQQRLTEQGELQPGAHKQRRAQPKKAKSRIFGRG